MKDDVLALALGEHRLPVCTDLNEAYSCISPKVTQILLTTHHSSLSSQYSLITLSLNEPFMSTGR